MVGRAAGRRLFAGVGTALLLCVAGPAAAGEDALTAAQREAVEQVVREYLRDNPEVLVDAIRALRAKREAAEQARKSQALVTYSEELRNDPASPVGGNPNGDVTVVEFFDYGCPYCKKVLPSIMTLLESDGNIRYVFKEFPILGPASHVAARAALAAWNLDKDSYLPFHAAMMGARGRLTEARIMKIAEDNGIDGTALRRAMADPKIDAALKANTELASALGINGTPAFVIGGEIVPGAVDLASLRRLIEAARKG